MGKVNSTIFAERINGDVLFICQLYVDDIIFGGACQKHNRVYRVVIIKIEMSMMGELKFFLIFQMKQLKERMFISQAKYVQDILKKFNMYKKFDMYKV